MDSETDGLAFIMDEAKQRRLVTILEGLPELETQGDRTILLTRCLPDDLRSTTRRSDIKRSDIESIVARCADREVSSDGPHPLGVLIACVRDIAKGAGYAQLVELIADLPTGFVPQLPPPSCPYPGMLAFTRENERFFYGRESEIEQMLSHLNSHRLLLVEGRSGSGKSSLIAAGLLPALSRKRPEIAQLETMRPGPQPARRLASRLGAPQGLLPSDEELPALVEAYIASHEPARSLLIVVDQLEEAFNQTGTGDAGNVGKNEQHRFFAALRKLREIETCILVLTMHTAFYPDLINLGLLQDIDTSERREINPLGGAAIRAAIRRPAAAQGVIVADELVERLAADAENQPGSLPLLQETMISLWREMEARTLTLASYEKMGQDGRSGLTVVIAGKADSVVNRLNRENGEAAERLVQRTFLRLVQFGEGRPDTRRQQPEAALYDDADDPVLRDKVLTALIDSRLIMESWDEGNPHERLLDISHEALLEGWRRLAVWIKPRRQEEQTRRLLEDKAKKWKRGPGRLLDSRELREAESWRSSKYARDLGESNDLKSLRRASKIGRVVAAFGLAVGLVILAGFLVYTLFEMYTHQVHNAQLQSALAINQIEAGNLEDGLRKAMDAASISRQLFGPVPTGAETALHLALLFPPPQEHLLLRAHKEQVNSGAYSLDGRYIVTAGQDGVAYIWDAQTDANPKTLKVGDHSVTSAAFSPDGLHVVTSSTDGSVKRWDVATGKEALPALGGPGRAVWTASYNPKGDRIVTASNDRTARVWDLARREVVFTMTVPSSQGGIRFQSAAYSPDGNFIITANGDGNVRIWQAQEGPGQGNVVRDLVGHTTEVLQAAYSPDGKYVVSASGDDTARIWETQTWQVLQTLRGHTDDVRSAAFSPDSKRIVTASADGTAKIWSAESGEVLLTMRPQKGALLSAVYSPDGKRIITASEDKTAKVWEPIEGEELHTLSGHSDSLNRAAYSPNGMRAVTASVDKTARVWDATTGVTMSTLTGHQGIVYSAVFSPDRDGKYILTASADKTAKIWDVHTITATAVLTTFTGHSEAVNSALFSPDGKRVVTACADGTARTWDIASGEKLQSFELKGGPMHTATYSPDGKLIATAQSDGTVVIWDAEKGNALHTWGDRVDPVITAFFSPDGKRLVIASGITARVLDVETGKVYFTLTGHAARVNSAVYSLDGQFIVTSSRDQTTRIWDAATGEERATLRGHTGAVKSAVFSPDGRSILTSGDDHTARRYFTRLEDLLKLASTRLPHPLPTPTP